MSERGEMTALVPASMTEARELSETLAKARAILPALKQSPADVLLVMQTGRELGILPMTALRTLHVIDGKVAISADQLVAIVRSKPACKYFRLIESSDRVATYETHREGDPAPVRMSFTAEQARRAGKLPGKPGSNWHAYTEDMLRARAKARLVREVYPDIVGGCYDPDEVGLPEGIDPARVVDVTSATVAPPAPAPARTAAPSPAAPAPSPNDDAIDAEIVEPEPAVEPSSADPEGDAEREAMRAELLTFAERMDEAQNVTDLERLRDEAAKAQLQGDEYKAARTAYARAAKRLGVGGGK